MKSLKTSFINIIKVISALDNPNGMANHSYNPSFVLKDIFHSSPSLILVWWYPLFKSSFENHIAPLRKSIMSSILGNGNLYLIVILLISLESVHILHSPSFFGVSTAGTAHGIRLFWTNPLSNNPWTCLLNSSFSWGVNLYASLFGKMAPGIKSIWWLIPSLVVIHWVNHPPQCH